MSVFEVKASASPPDELFDGGGEREEEDETVRQGL